MLFGHGDDHYNSQKEVKINFSSNVWHGADLRTLREHLNGKFCELTRYPEPDASSLKRLLARCYEVAGITNKDRIHITPGYGLWTAGIGFQLGAERLGAMAVPLGPAIPKNSCV